MYLTRKMLGFWLASLLVAPSLGLAQIDLFLITTPSILGVSVDSQYLNKVDVDAFSFSIFRPPGFAGTQSDPVASTFLVSRDSLAYGVFLGSIVSGTVFSEFKIVKRVGSVSSGTDFILEEYDFSDVTIESINRFDLRNNQCELVNCVSNFEMSLRLDSGSLRHTSRSPGSGGNVLTTITDIDFSTGVVTTVPEPHAAGFALFFVAWFIHRRRRSSSSQ